VAARAPWRTPPPLLLRHRRPSRLPCARPLRRRCRLAPAAPRALKHCPQRRRPWVHLRGRRSSWVCSLRRRQTSALASAGFCLSGPWCGPPSGCAVEGEQKGDADEGGQAAQGCKMARSRLQAAYVRCVARRDEGLRRESGAGCWCWCWCRVQGDKNWSKTDEKLERTKSGGRLSGGSAARSSAGHRESWSTARGKTGLSVSKKPLVAQRGLGSVARGWPSSVSR